jgi:hypothetical protein
MHRVQTRGEAFAETSGAFTLTRQRILENPWHAGVSSKQKAADRKDLRTRAVGKFKGAPTGGGGTRRAAFHKLVGDLGGGGNAPKEVRSAAFSEAHRLVAEASEDSLIRVSTDTHVARMFL